MLLLEIVILLGVCLVFGAAMSRFKQNPLVGYLFAGMLLGGLGVMKSKEHIDVIAELGVALLLFSLGLEFSWNRLKQLGARALLSGAVQVIATGAAITVVSLLFHLRLVEAVAVGAMLSLSSTAAVLHVLANRSEIDSQHGRYSLAILLVQDMAVVPLAIVMVLLSKGGTPGEVALDVGRAVGLAAGLIILLYVVIKFSTVKILPKLSTQQNRELVTLFAVVVSLGAAGGAHKAGLSPALGAFVAGMFLGSSPFASQIRAEVSSLRVVLLTLFFGAVGMVADPIWIFHHAGLVLMLTVLVIAGKSTVIWVILRSVGRPGGVSAATGLCLSQIGEFAFVLGGVARIGGVIDQELYMTLVSVGIMTLLVTPYLIALAPKAALWVETRRKKTPAASQVERTNSESAPRIIIIGFGPAGQAVGQTLVKRNQTATVIDLNTEMIRIARSMGFDVCVGDASHRDVLEHAHVKDAELIVIALPAKDAALTVLDHLRMLAPKAQLIVRSRYQRFTNQFKTAGAHIVVGDEEQVGRALSVQIRKHLRPRGAAPDGAGKLDR